LEAVARGGGSEVVDFVAAGDEEGADLIEPGDIVASGGGMVDGGLFEEVQVSGVVDVAKGIEVVVADANMGEVEMRGVTEIGGRAHDGGREMASRREGAVHAPLPGGWFLVMPPGPDG